MATEVTTQASSLAQQVRDRLAALKVQATKVEVACTAAVVGMFANGETREMYEKRIMDTPDAWSDSNNNGDILPR
jgi:hypothetical protein